MSRRETDAERAERLIAELGAASREAAGLIKDLSALIKSARAEVEEYLEREVARALVEHNERLLATLVKLHQNHQDQVIKRVIDFAALIENNFSREALVREAADHIEKLVMESLHGREHVEPAPPGTIYINACDRPHAD